VYFDSVTMFVFFLLGGRYLEMTARQKAVSVTEALAKLLPAFAQKMPNFPVDRSTEQCVVADLLRGDIVLVRPVISCRPTVGSSKGSVAPMKRC
jgi:Cu2+-exporting ATPase